MLINWETSLIGSKVILVPYKKDHVLKYHEWMKSEELQTLTGSEPLSLKEEYEMQNSWRLDDDKCTFIILSKEQFERSGSETESMIGDTNLFVCRGDNSAEAEIMIAESKYRGHKMGWEAMLLMLRYGIETLKIKQYQAKIKMENSASLKMFHKIGFSEMSRSEVFQEITLACEVSPDFCNWLAKNSNMITQNYTH